MKKKNKFLTKMLLCGVSFISYLSISSVSYAEHYGVLLNPDFTLNDGDRVDRLVLNGSSNVSIVGSVEFDNQSAITPPEGLNDVQTAVASSSTVSIFDTATLNLGNNSIVIATGEGGDGTPQRNLMGIWGMGGTVNANNLTVDVSSFLGSGNQTYLYGIRHDASIGTYNGNTNITTTGDTTGITWGVLATNGATITFDNLNLEANSVVSQGIAVESNAKITFDNYTAKLSGPRGLGIFGLGGTVEGNNIDFDLTAEADNAMFYGIFSNQASSVTIHNNATIKLTSQWDNVQAIGIISTVKDTNLTFNNVNVSVTLDGANNNRVHGIYNSGGNVIVNGAFSMDGMGLNPTSSSAYIYATGADSKITLKGSIFLGSNALNENERALYASNNSTILANAQQKMTIYGDIIADAGFITLDAGNSSFLKGGSLIANAGSIDLTLRDSSQWDMTKDSTVSTLNNINSTINFSYDDSFKTLTVEKDYHGENGVIVFNTVLGDDTSATDFLHVTGNATGTTSVQVINRGGLGALTTGNGIQLIQVDGTSEASNFALKSDYQFEGKNAVVGGAYAYSLYAGDQSGNFTGDWYLRSLTVPPEPEKPINPENPTNPEGPTNPEKPDEPGYPVNPEMPNGPSGPSLSQKPVYQPGAPLYEVYPQVLLEMNKLGTLQQRIGNRTWLGQNRNGVDTAGVIEGSGFWMKIEGLTSHINPNKSTTNAKYDINMVKTQLGLDFVALENDSGTLIGGAYFQYGHAKSDVSSRFGKGDVKVDGYGLGGTLTWYGNNDVYVDGVAQVMWYKSDINSDTLNKRETDGNKGMGYSLSVEVGKKFALQNGWNITPQAQLSYNSIDFDSFRDAYQAKVSRKDGDALTGRLGVALDRETAWKSEAGDMRRLKVYGIANLYYEFLDGTEVEVTGVKFRNRSDRLWAGIGAGISHSWKDDKYSIYGEVNARSSLNDFGKSYALNGTVGFRVKF